MANTYDYLPDKEQAFKEAVGGLSNYKRAAAFEYVAALRKIIEQKDKEISELAYRQEQRSTPHPPDAGNTPVEA